MGKYNFDEVIDRRGTDCYKWDGMARVYEDDGLIHLGCADMDFRAPKPVLDALQRTLDHGVFGYARTGEHYFEGIIDWYKKRHNLEVKREHILYTPRLNIACSLCVEAFTRPGDKVILNAPSYPPLLAAALSNGRFVIDSPMAEDGDGYRLDLDALKKQVDDRTRLMILVNPHNPTTHCFSRDELYRIASFCHEHDLVLFCDEIHADFVKKGFKFCSMWEGAGEYRDHVIIASSPAKTFNVMGLQTAYLITQNKEHQRAFNLQLQRLGLDSPNVFANAMMKAAYQECEDYVDELNLYIDQNEERIRTELPKIFPKVRFKCREGSYLLWIDFREVFETQEQMMDFFIKKARVEVYEGTHFGPTFERFVRIVLGTSRFTLEEAVERIKKAAAGF